jgi:hypothetical protein
MIPTKMKRRPVNNSDRPGFRLWERVKNGRLSAHEGMAILRGLEPVHYAQLSTYKRLARRVE